MDSLASVGRTGCTSPPSPSAAPPSRSCDDIGALVRTYEFDVDGDGATIRVHTTLPAQPAHRSLLLLHEKRGLDDHTRHVAAKLAARGFTVFCPDLRSRYGTHATPRTPSARGLPVSWIVSDLEAVTRRIVQLHGTRTLGCVGYSFGGELGVRLALQRGEIDAVVAYYSHLSSTLIQSLTVPALAIFADTPEQLDRLSEVASVGGEGSIEVRHFAGQRAFDNPHRPDRYDSTSATGAWSLMLTWLDDHLPEPAPDAHSSDSRA